jgi:Tol biopolymer transport system component
MQRSIHLAAFLFASVLADGALAATTERVLPVDPASPDGSSHPDVSTSGNEVVFARGVDVFVLDRAKGETERVSVGPNGAGPDDACAGPAISGDGRFVAFVSRATTLAPGNEQRAQAVFLHDRNDGSIRVVSIPHDGSPLTRDSHLARLSGDGCVLAFLSHASNLVPNDGNNARDVFVHDCKKQAIELASASSSGGFPHDSSGDYGMDLSRDGGHVVFATGATNMVPNDTNGAVDVFVRDRAAGETVRVSIASEGGEANGPSGVPGGSSISDDGQVIAFQSAATNLVPGDGNGVADVFVHERKTRRTTRVSVASDGAQANGESSHPRLSGDGRFVAFLSVASNLVAGDDNRCENSQWFARDACGIDLFVHDRTTGQTIRASLGTDGKQIENDAKVASPEISGDGRVVVFESTSTTLVAGDVNGVQDVFVRDFGK